VQEVYEFPFSSIKKNIKNMTRTNEAHVQFIYRQHAATTQ